MIKKRSKRFLKLSRKKLPLRLLAQIHKISEKCSNKKRMTARS
jgi:hypothetical protein